MNKVIDGHGTGWLRDLPDSRDYKLDMLLPQGVNLGVDQRYKLGVKLRNLLKGVGQLPQYVDLRQWCSPVENQGHIGSCTAFAGAGLVEYSMRKVYDWHVDISPLFLYKVTRNLMGVTGDTGAWLRDTLRALAMCGVPPDQYWPYDVARFDQEPSALLYSLGQNYQAIQYMRLDTPGLTPTQVLERVKIMLVAGFPSAFGFTVYDSIHREPGWIPFPEPGERVVGGHAVCAVGYDDRLVIGERLGGFLVRNSWGTGWGREGYGYLPYEYVLQGLAVDWWSILKQEWIDTGVFGA